MEATANDFDGFLGQVIGELVGRGYIPRFNAEDVVAEDIHRNPSWLRDAFASKNRNMVEVANLLLMNSGWSNLRLVSVQIQVKALKRAYSRPGALCSVVNAKGALGFIDGKLLTFSGVDKAQTWLTSLSKKERDGIEWRAMSKDDWDAWATAR